MTKIGIKGNGYTIQIDMGTRIFEFYTKNE